MTEIVLAEGDRNSNRVTIKRWKRPTKTHLFQEVWHSHGWLLAGTHTAALRDNQKSGLLGKFQELCATCWGNENNLPPQEETCSPLGHLSLHRILFLNTGFLLDLTLTAVYLLRFL
ncbi:Lysine-Specific Demethylase 4A [Manis pentadactyla]|nr:Lysine-Specific Demethylase 4A [Manis pentadactyla]